MADARINPPDLDATSGSKLVRYAFNRLLSHTARTDFLRPTI